MRATVIGRQKDAAEARLRELRPLLKPESKIVVTHFQDDLVDYNNKFLFDPINQANLTLNVVEPNTEQVLVWREDFAKRVPGIWQAGGDVWVTKRLLSPRPRAEWNWVEGDDKRISWRNLFDYFAPFETGMSVGNEDGFVLLVPSDKNRRLLKLYFNDGEL